MEQLLTILFAEDDAAVRYVVGEMLSEKGFRVLVASDGYEAVRLLAEHHVDLLFTDIGMPGMGRGAVGAAGQGHAPRDQGALRHGLRAARGRARGNAPGKASVQAGAFGRSGKGNRRAAGHALSPRDKLVYASPCETSRPIRETHEMVFDATTGPSPSSGAPARAASTTT